MLAASGGKHENNKYLTTCRRHLEPDTTHNTTLNYCGHGAHSRSELVGKQGMRRIAETVSWNEEENGHRKQHQGMRRIMETVSGNEEDNRNSLGNKREITETVTRNEVDNGNGEHSKTQSL